MGLFKKKCVVQSYDKENKKPVIKASICNGEQVAGFKDIHTGKIDFTFSHLYAMIRFVHKCARNQGLQERKDRK